MSKTIKKNFFAPFAPGLGATRRAAMLLLVMMLTTATAWAETKTIIYTVGLDWDPGAQGYCIQGNNGDKKT